MLNDFFQDWVIIVIIIIIITTQLIKAKWLRYNFW